MNYELTYEMRENIKIAMMERLDHILYTSDWDLDDWDELPSFDDIENSIHALDVLGYTSLAKSYMEDYKEKRGI